MAVSTATVGDFTVWAHPNGKPKGFPTWAKATAMADWLKAKGFFASPIHPWFSKPYFVMVAGA